MKDSKCPNGEPHYWFINCELHGICKKCGKEREFPYRLPKYEAWQGKGFIPIHRGFIKDKAKSVRNAT